MSKIRVIAASLADMAIDLLLPMAVYLLLAPTHLPVVIRLTLGGFLVAGKSAAGRAGHAGQSASRRRLGLAAAVTAAACAATVIASSAGAGATGSILAGTVICAVGTGLLMLRMDRRHIDGFAILVLCELAIGVIIVLVSSDPRFVLARPAVYTAVAGVYAFCTLRGRPFMMDVTRPIAVSGDPVRADAFDRAWHESGRFRSAERLLTLSVGVMLLAEAVLRVVVVYSQPEGAVLKASLLSQLPALGLLVLWFLIARFLIVPVASKEVDALMVPPATEGRAAPGAGLSPGAIRP